MLFEVQRDRCWFSPLPLEFGILLKLLSSEDEIVVANAALCLGNCMEVSRAASSLLKTDIVQVLLRHAGGDAQKTAVQLNAGIALGKLCTAEPRYAPAPSRGGPRQLHPGRRRASRGTMWWPCGGWASVPPRTLWRAPGVLVLPVHTGVRPSSYIPKRPGLSGSSERGGRCFSDRHLSCALTAIIFPPFHSLLLF